MRKVSLSSFEVSGRIIEELVKEETPKDDRPKYEDISNYKEDI